MQTYNIEIEEETLDSPETENKVSGLLVINKDKNLILVNISHPDNRKRFTKAHELGHYILHKEICPLFIDSSQLVYRRDNISAEGSRLDEIEANTFAAELLMPEKKLREEFSNKPPFNIMNETEIMTLADNYKVSYSAMTYRLINLGLMTI